MLRSLEAPQDSQALSLCPFLCPLLSCRTRTATTRAVIRVKAHRRQAESTPESLELFKSLQSTAAWQSECPQAYK